MSLYSITFNQALPLAAAQWTGDSRRAVILPAPGADGVLPDHEGRRQVVSEPAALTRRLNDQPVDARIDIDHRTECKSPTYARTSQADGWCSEYRVEAGGAISALLELMPHAADLVRRRVYRYLSPAI